MENRSPILPEQKAVVWKDQSLQWSRDQKHLSETL